MFILGIDTSCDDTSASVVKNGTQIVSNIVSSQHEIHKKFGGIIPELASRRHMEMIVPVVDEALKKADLILRDLSAIAVCCGPGLIGSLIVGVSFAKSVCYARGIPLVAVNHLEGHLLSPFLNANPPDFPFIALIVSGGHTHLYRVNGFGKYTELGRTRDDAAGEAYDKVAKMLRLSYPGGPAIDAAAKSGNPFAIQFPRPYLSNSLDFSFSGLKTSVYHYIEQNKSLKHNDIAASFQSAVIDVIRKKIIMAVEKENISRVVISGGVAANSRLRTSFQDIVQKEGVDVIFPPLHLCTDNAAMIASAGYYRFKNKEKAELNLNPRANFPL